MGNTAWIEAQGRPVAETRSDLSILMALDRELDALAKKLGVTSLSEFQDDSVMVAECNRFAREAGIPEGKVEPKWLNSAKGLQSVKAIRSQLDRDFTALNWDPQRSQKRWPEYLLKELKFCEEVLEEAAGRGARFHLLMVP